jgi:aldehyde dehydrogenase (NAD+)
VIDRSAWEREVANKRYSLLINGQWIATGSGGRLQCLDPFTLKTWGEIPVAGEAEIDDAVTAARHAFVTGWGRTSPSHRAGLLRRLASLCLENAESLGIVQVLENGKLLSEMRGTGRALASQCNFFASLGETLHGHTVGHDLPNFAAFTRREPIGVVAAITPWNTPLGLLGLKLFPALAAGNTVVVKPSEVTPVSTLMLGELIEKAGFPPGVVNIVTGGPSTGEMLVAHPWVDKIAFTGSTTTGAKIGAAAAQRHARVSLELGGKSPNIIFNDANKEAVIPGIASGIFAASGQACNAGSRVLVQTGIYDEVAERLSAFARRMRVGDPLLPETELGPLASRAQFDKVLSYMQIGKSEGFSAIAGGGKIDREGYFVEATVFDKVRNDARIAREEIFGPVACLIRFDDEDEAIAIANDTRYGLASGIWTSSLARAHRVSERIRAGVVWINTYRIGGPSMPFGGMRESGIGREGGLRALDQYTEEKAVWINMAEHFDNADSVRNK